MNDDLAHQSREIDKYKSPPEDRDERDEGWGRDEENDQQPEPIEPTQ